MHLEFHLQDIRIDSLETLVELNDMMFNLDGINNYGSYEYTSGGIGQIFFGKVSLEDSANIDVFSGTFGFQIEDYQSENVNVYYGRFDYTLDRFGFEVRR